MELTKKERVFLLNQYRILAKLYPEDETHYKELIEILNHGFQIFYSMVDEWISEDMPKDEGVFVIEILDIYRAIEDLKRTISSDKISKHTYSYFHGFDGNQEPEYMGFARFLINEQGKFAEQQQYLRINDGLNSHAPMIDKYKRMVKKWKELGEGYKFTEAQALHILDA
jgi:uncharacterized protein YfbU (UPF0304 family)